VEEAVKVALDLERASVKFYEDHLKKTSDSLTEKFLRHMVDEEKGHLLVLLDMQYYYSDPEGYFMEKEHRGLDGA
jgi:rubrerythrin